jgi:hypothetical protein
MIMELLSLIDKKLWCNSFLNKTKYLIQMNKTAIILFTIFAIQNTTAQIRSIDGTPTTVLTSSAFLDASSSVSYDTSTNSGKGIVFPRVNLTTFTAFLGENGTGISFRNRYDGFMVFNTATSGTAGIGATQGQLTPGFWFYDNSAAGVGAGTISGGTWRPIGSSSDKNITAAETWLGKINGTQIYAIYGSFTLPTEAMSTTITEPTGMTKIYRLTIYQNGIQIGINSYTTGNIIFGGDNYAALRTAGTYNYTLEYFK